MSSFFPPHKATQQLFFVVPDAQTARVAMAFVPFIGDKRAKLLLEHLGSPEAIFSEKVCTL